MRQMMQGVSFEENSKEAAASMGEGAEKMIMEMMMGMPLGGLVSYGYLTPEQLNGIVAALNGE